MELSATFAASRAVSSATASDNGSSTCGSGGGYQTPTFLHSVDGLSFNVMKAQEFAFQSKLAHHHHSSAGHAAVLPSSYSGHARYQGHHHPQFTSNANSSTLSYAAVGSNVAHNDSVVGNSRSRSMTLPVSHNQHHFHPDELYLGNGGGIAVPRAAFDNGSAHFINDSLSSSVSSSVSGGDDYLPPSSFGSSSLSSSFGHSQQRRASCAVPIGQASSLNNAGNYKDIDHYNRRLRNNSVSLQTINEGLISNDNNSTLFMAQMNQQRRVDHHKRLLDEQNHLRFIQQQKTNFMSGDPRSGRLSEFVSRMVYVIFWQGSESFSKQMQAVCSASSLDGNNAHSTGQDVEIHELQNANTCYPPPEFQDYTRYLLETMQVSCSTALLSLFYLHRLRPKVKHMFVEGTFNDGQQGQKRSSRRYTYSSGEGQQYQQQQYRRDAKLEYRLFTVALILANKYLDDNSYSNKAWSEVTGLDLNKLNIMELEFMKFIDYTLLVKEREYLVWVRWLESFISVVMEDLYVASRYAPTSPLLYPSGYPSPVSPASISPNGNTASYRPVMQRRYSEAATLGMPHGHAAPIVNYPNVQYPRQTQTHASFVSASNSSQSFKSIPKFPVSSNGSTSTLPTPKSIRKLEKLNIRPLSHHQPQHQSPTPVAPYNQFQLPSHSTTNYGHSQHFYN